MNMNDETSDDDVPVTPLGQGWFEVKVQYDVPVDRVSICTRSISTSLLVHVRRHFLNRPGNLEDSGENNKTKMKLDFLGDPNRTHNCGELRKANAGQTCS